MEKLIQCNFGRRNNGFTLVEISIALIVISVALAGIAAGTSLYKQTQLSSVIQDMRGYIASYNGFEAKYNAVPGDMVGAYTIFGANCADNQADCDGNGNGLIEQTNNEVNKAWVHLSLSGIVSQQFPPLTSDTTSKVGINTPISKVSNAGYILMSSESPQAAMFGAEGTAVMLGSNGNTGETLTGGALPPTDAFAIDEKIDDGGYDSSGNPIGATTGYFRAYDRMADINCSNSSNNSYTFSQTQDICIVGMAITSDLGILLASLSTTGSENNYGPLTPDDNAFENLYGAIPALSQLQTCNPYSLPNQYPGSSLLTLSACGQTAGTNCIDVYCDEGNPPIFKAPDLVDGHQLYFVLYNQGGVGDETAPVTIFSWYYDDTGSPQKIFFDSTFGGSNPDAQFYSSAGGDYFWDPVGNKALFCVSANCTLPTGNTPIGTQYRTPYW